MADAKINTKKIANSTTLMLSEFKKFIFVEISPKMLDILIASGRKNTVTNGIKDANVAISKMLANTDITKQT